MDKDSVTILLIALSCLVGTLANPLGQKQDEIQQHTDGLRKIRSIYAYGMPLKELKNNGEIERVTMTMAVKKSPTQASISRKTRSVPQVETNVLEDLEGQEAKVFRPLFVYRKQVADRYRINRTRNPIYGAYQYGTGPKRQRSV